MWAGFSALLPPYSGPPVHQRLSEPEHLQKLQTSCLQDDGDVIGGSLCVTSERFVVDQPVDWLGEGSAHGTQCFTAMRQLDIPCKFN